LLPTISVGPWPFTPRTRIGGSGVNRLVSVPPRFGAMPCARASATDINSGALAANNPRRVRPGEVASAGGNRVMAGIPCRLGTDIQADRAAISAPLAPAG